MPTYDYECLKCGYKFESFERIQNTPTYKKCPQCGTGKAKRLIGNGGGLIFKGSGFYITDYKKCNKNNIDSSQKEKSSQKKEEKASVKNVEGNK